MRKILTATLAAGAMVAGVAQAGTTGTTFQVSATVLATCSATAGPLTFPNYTPGGGNQKGQTNILVSCTNKAAFTVALDKGSTVGGTIGQRLMFLSAGNTLQYNLYQDAAFGTLFGDGTTGKTLTGTGTGINTAVTVPVFGQLLDSPTNQAASVGTYTDTVNVTVTF
jgi:spore coat protein U-like protein